MSDLSEMRQLTARIGNNPLLTQASTGNSSLKLDGSLWIKGSGKWMADALTHEIFLKLNLAKVTRECLEETDPAEVYPGASLETALHALLPHRVVVHVHSVNAIAWAVRSDAAERLADRLDGLPWQWIPYVPSGLPLAREVKASLLAYPDTTVFVLGNHGLVLGGRSCEDIEDLLHRVEERLCILPREAPPADEAALASIAKGSRWNPPVDGQVHCLATDDSSQSVLSGGLLYPCQALLSGAPTAEVFHSLPFPESGRRGWRKRYRDRPMLIFEGRGLLVARILRPAELATLSGLAQVVQRIPPSAPLRYLKDSEVAAARAAVTRYRDLSNKRSAQTPRIPPGAEGSPSQMMSAKLRRNR